MFGYHMTCPLWLVNPRCVPSMSPNLMVYHRFPKDAAIWGYTPFLDTTITVYCQYIRILFLFHVYMVVPIEQCSKPYVVPFFWLGVVDCDISLNVLLGSIIPNHSSNITYQFYPLISPKFKTASSGENLRHQVLCRLQSLEIPCTCDGCARCESWMDFLPGMTHHLQMSNLYV